MRYCKFVVGSGWDFGCLNGRFTDSDDRYIFDSYRGEGRGENALRTWEFFAGVLIKRNLGLLGGP